MPPRKFSDEKLIQLVKEGNKAIEIARILGVNRATICRRLKGLNIGVASSLTIHHASKIVKKELNAMSQLLKINDYANELLDLLMRWNRGDKEALQILETQVRIVKYRGQEEEVTEYKFKDPRELALRAMSEIRGQLKLQLEIFQALYDMQAIAAFQQEVLETIASVAPEIRDQIIQRLKERSAIRSTIDLH